MTIDKAGIQWVELFLKDMYIIRRHDGELDMCVMNVDQEFAAATYNEIVDHLLVM